MLEFGKYAPFIWAAYGVSAVTIVLLILWAKGPKP